MTTRNIISFGIILTLTSCGQPTIKVGYGKINKKINLKTDSSNQYIYDFMKVVLAEQKLDVNYGLAIEPEEGCDLSQDDKVFLKTLLIEKTQPKTDTGDFKNMTITINLLPKCLTTSDINEMLIQKDKLSDFTWDNSRLGFNLSNTKNWYCFSRPLFSVDRQKAVMMIRSLCTGLCGTGWTVVFTKQNNNWISQTGVKWLH